MPVLNYYDPVTQSYKPVVGGMTQDSADARYLIAGRRNALRNGDMNVYQRGTGTFSTYGGLTLDGWYLDGNGGSSSVSRSTDVTTASGLLVCSTSGQALAGHYVRMQQLIEDVRAFNGQTVTISFSAKAASGSPNLAIEVEQLFGTGGSPSGLTQTWGGTVSLTTTMTRYTKTFAIPSTAGKTLGTTFTSSYLALGLWLSAGSGFNSRVPLLTPQNNTFTITDVQLEAGPVATPFERLSFQEQLAWNQRYFWRLGQFTGGMVNFAGSWFRLGVGVVRGGSSNDVVIQYPVPMRTVPTIAFTAPSTFANWDGSASPVCTSVSIGDCTSNVSANIYPAGATLTANAPAFFLVNSVAAGYIDFSADY